MLKMEQIEDKFELVIAVRVLQNFQSLSCEITNFLLDLCWFQKMLTILFLIKVDLNAF